MLTLLPGLILIGIGVYFLYPVLLSFMALGAVIVLLFFVVFIPLIILIKIFGFNPDNDKHAKTAKPHKGTKPKRVRVQKYTQNSESVLSACLYFLWSACHVLLLGCC